MESKAYINETEAPEEFASMCHRIRSKLMLSVKLNNKERSFYLLFIASVNEASEYLKNEKK